MGFPDSSVGKESACNAGGPGSIPGLGRSAGEEIGYPLQYYWASLVAQLVKNPPAMWETWVSSLGWEDPLEKGKATHSSILAWRIYLDSLCNKQMSGFSGPRCCGWQGLYSSAGGEQWSTSNTVCWHWWLLGRKVRKKNKEQGRGGGWGQRLRTDWWGRLPWGDLPRQPEEEEGIGASCVSQRDREFLEHFGLGSLKKVGGRK